ncbi:hypothetical protein WKT22_02003 [Candidatus Lokiarchaeum ossiferum]
MRAQLHHVKHLELVSTHLRKLRAENPWEFELLEFYIDEFGEYYGQAVYREGGDPFDLERFSRLQSLTSSVWCGIVSKCRKLISFLSSRQSDVSHGIYPYFKELRMENQGKNFKCLLFAVLRTDCILRKRNCFQLNVEKLAEVF